MNQLSEVLHAMNSYGFQVDGIVPDGKIHRFKRDHDDKGKCAWYVCFQNVSNKGETFFVCEFGDWREPGENKKFMTNFVQTKHDRAVIEKQMKDAQERFEIERQRVWEETADACKEEWENFRKSGASGYLEGKNLNPTVLYGSRYLPGAIYVPVRDVHGRMWGYQKITDNGDKYFRENCRKEGCFHVVGGEIKGAERVFFAEGFATAITVHLATRSPVVVAFDSGNLPSVLAACRGAHKETAFIVCGDDDRWNRKPDGTPTNPGREKAEEAARASLASVVFPEFQNVDAQPTDFDDLRQLEGLEAVKAILDGLVVEAQRLVCLGHLGDAYYYTSSSNQQIVQVSRGGHTKHSLLDLMPIAYWEAQYPSKTGVDWDRAASEMMASCREAGIFHPENVRGSGVWRDAGRTVVNMGNRLSVDGEIVPVSGIRGAFIYEIARRLAPIHEKPLTPAEGMRFVEALEIMRWKKPEYAKLAAGWLMVAPLSGALPWRPHVWVTGPSGSGKTWFSNYIVGRILGANKVSVKGATTEAGIRQTIRSDAMPLVFDEFETDDERSAERIRGLLELIRQASSEDDGFVVKGSTSGKSVQYRVRFSALVSSIRLNLEREQDKNRFTVLDLERGSGEQSAQLAALKKALVGVDEEFGRRMFSRGVKLLPTILANYDKLSAMLSDKHNARFGQHYGILLAGYGALIHDEPLKDDECKFLVDSIDLQTEAEAVDERDEQECLDHLLRKEVVVDLDGRRELTIGRLIAEHQTAVTESAKTGFDLALQGIGLKLSKSELIVAVSHPKLRALFRGTKWTSNWSKPLLRIAGSRNANVRIEGRQTKAIAVPLESLGFELVAR